MGKKKNKEKKLEDKLHDSKGKTSRKAFFKALGKKFDDLGFFSNDISDIKNLIKTTGRTLTVGANTISPDSVNRFVFNAMEDETDVDYVVVDFLKRLRTPHTTSGIDVLSCRDAIIVAITSSLMSIGYQFDLLYGAIAIKANNLIVAEIAPVFIGNNIYICLSSVEDHGKYSNSNKCNYLGDPIATFHTNYADMYDEMPRIVGEITTLITPSKPAVHVIDLDKSLTPEEVEELIEELELEEEYKLPEDFEAVDRRKSAQEVLDEHEEKLINTRVEVVEILSDLNAEEPIRKESNNSEEFE